MKKSTLAMLLVAIAALAVAGVLLLVNALSARGDLEKSLVIEENGTATETLEVTALNIYPGETREYVVKVSCKLSGSYRITLDFQETEDGGLKPFVDVTVLLGDKEIATAPLATVLAGEDIVLDCDLEPETTQDLVIRYSMPIGVDDAAQKTTASFDLVFTVSQN